MTWKRRTSLAVAGAFCIFLLIATGFIANTRPGGYFIPSFSSAQPSEEAGQDKGVPVPAPSSPHAIEALATQAPVLGSLQEFSRFDGYGLASGECDAEFSDLFKEIERSAAQRKDIGNITSSDIDLHWKEDGALRAMIWRQKSKLEGEYVAPRALSILHQIDRAIITSSEPVPDIEFSLTFTDVPDDSTTETHSNHTFWALSRLPHDKNMWIMPDFGYWTWPLDLVGSYEQIRVEMAKNQLSWKERVPRLLWRGALKTNKVRQTMYQTTRGKSWADIEEVKWKSRTKVSASSAASAISMADHCNYQYLLHTEGRSYSGRGKYLLNCGSVVIMHKSEWIEPHQDVYVKSGAEQNIVEVERDFSDLEGKMQQLLNQPELAESIANNSQKTFRDRYMTPAAQACYWRKLFHVWAGVSFRPEPFEVVNGKSRLRGVPFETFV
ncbi:hypothetical protein P171DRAFT_348654 [Karstenula rhodostoma CBS 690.94]|uniref:Glycosyl transferase CAP10 domain-containing protein n=1 Tax=Karstenula rhodostoma CBS 690.94 TaxID=1392251 RepID=A0A9P4PXA8_9PLEO|nr:hypothetical protein P171DRAFT_348654 [Karstenula rhodostoma CBS 690.94]